MAARELTPALLSWASLLDDADWSWVRHAVMRMLVNHVSLRRGLRRPWPLPGQDAYAPTPADLDGPSDRLAVIDVTGWTMAEVADVYQALLQVEPDGGGTLGKSNDRAELGSYYTPDPLAGFLSGFSMQIAVKQVMAEDPSPMALLRIRAIDPACGAGVMLVRTAADLARLYAGRLFNEPEPSDELVDAVLPTIMDFCIYGVDVDEVAVDLTKTALWWTLDGRPDIRWMDRHVICGDVLAGDEPPALADRNGGGQ